MQVYLTFDIEIWCNGWENLDANFPGHFERYVFGRSKKGDYALPKTLEILERHGLLGVFFIEPLFAARFGIQYLTTMANIIKAGQHDIQLHLHPEWTDEIQPPIFPDNMRKRQHLSYYTLAEQSRLISLGLTLLADAGCNAISAFRAGSFACNADTYRALRNCGILLDSSLNLVHPNCGIDLRNKLNFLMPQEFEGIKILPQSVFKDGFGNLRPAQIGACSNMELQQALTSAADQGTEHFVILSHNFEMLRVGRSDPDMLVVRRFERLCEFLAKNNDLFQVTTMSHMPEINAEMQSGIASTTAAATTVRYVEQIARRLQTYR